MYLTWPERKGKSESNLPGLGLELQSAVWEPRTFTTSPASPEESDFTDGPAMNSKQRAGLTVAQRGWGTSERHLWSQSKWQQRLDLSFTADGLAWSTHWTAIWYVFPSITENALWPLKAERLWFIKEQEPQNKGGKRQRHLITSSSD